MAEKKTGKRKVDKGKGAQTAKAASGGSGARGAPAAQRASNASTRASTGVYLRVEGLNISAVIDDTDQLSVARGASFLLREAIGEVQSVLPENTKVLSVGASIGEFLLPPSTDRSGADRVVADIGRVLNDPNKAHRHLSFGVSAEGYVPSTSELAVRERALARIRFGQIRSPTCVTTAENQVPTRGVCAWDGRRVADAAQPVRREGEDDLAVSTSVWERWESGRDRKQGFYRDEAKLTQAHPAYGFRYSRDLGDLAREARAGNLNGKVAVIYADGNRFSRIREQTCRTFKDLTAFDATIRDRRRAYLSDLLAVMSSDDRYHMRDANGQRRLRLETLLWGGDELLLVVPAWCGFDIVQHLFKSFEGWAHGGFKLTHSVGLVFCRAKTPIQRSMTLARQLAEGVKDRLKLKATGRDKAQRLASELQNRFDYMVLESIDFPVEGDLSEFFSRRYGSALSLRTDLAPDPDWLKNRVGLASFLDGFPKAQAYAVSRAAVASDWSAQPPDLLTYQQAIERMEQVTRRHALDRAALRSVLGSAQGGHSKGIEKPDPWMWIHLAELWDYLCPTLAETARAAAFSPALVEGGAA